MVAHVLRLRLALLLGALRREGRGRAIVALLAVIAVTTAVCAAVLSLVDAPLPVARTVLLLGAGAVTLGFLLGPVLVGTVDQLDPRRFAVFGVDERRMPWVLLPATLVSIPSLALIAVSACAVVVVVQHGAPWPLAVGTAAGGVLSAVLAARIGMAAGALVLPERRSRELTALVVLGLVVVAFPVVVFFASLQWDGQVPGPVADAAEALALSPFAAAPATAWAAAGAPVEASGVWVRGVIAALSLGVLLLAWNAVVRRLLTTTERPVAGRERVGLGWFAVLPATPFGAVAARSLVYWLRDRRYLVNLIVVPIVGILTVFPLLVAGVPLAVAALVPVPVMALFFGWLPHNDIAYDSTALWIHVAAGVRGISDRLGRLIPVVLIAVPVLAVAIPLTLSTVDGWHLAVPFIGLAVNLFLAGLGLSSISSAVFPYAVSRPGDSPFQQPQRSAARGAVGQAGAFVGTVLLSAPTVWLFAQTVQGEELGLVTLGVGVGAGLVVLVVGAMVGGRVYERSGERLMEFVETA